MFETIQWHCFAQAADRRTAERLVARLAARSPLPVEIESYERYWKSPELADLRLVSPLRGAAPDQALLTTLECAWAFATPWSLANPDGGTRHEFTGIASADTGARFTVAGVEWMEFLLTDRP
ncbi:hypothetical protein AB0L85_12495 [Streptomyces sp. NPDC052051]|uniref:hypothetical protein n=1 Tax=Streptomyces sp. NPDC052051 TaxID=3154649 RepID=UPI0034439D68